ncbi:MAG: peptidase MA family metallohydrolase [Candidatus Promineifilaceae bacterium]
MLLLLFGLLLFGVGALTVGAQSAQAQTAALPVVSNDAIVDFPNTATFRLELDSSVTIADAVLTYQQGVASCLEAGTRVPVEDIEGSTAEWVWVMSRSGNPPPGAAVWWEWTVTDTDGNTFTTPRQQLVFQDDRFQWQTVEAENIQLHWYEGSNVGPTLLDAAVKGLSQLETDVGIQLGDEIQLFIYGSSADMRDAVLYIQDWAGGVAFSNYNIILIGVPPSIADSWGAATVRHELAHLVIGRFGQSCLGGSRPTWLDEGLAVYSEGEPDEETLSDIEKAVEANSFYPVRSLNGAFPSHDSDARLAYSESYSLVNFLLETYGPEKMQDLLLTLAQAESYDAALEQVYGFNADGLETAWRQAIGAQPRQIPPTPTPISAASIPTIVPLNGAQSVPTQPPPGAAVSSSAEPAPTIVVTAVAVLPATVPGETPPAETVPPPTAVPTAEPGGIQVCGIGAIPLLGIALVYLGRSKRRTPHE